MDRCERDSEDERSVAGGAPGDATDADPIGSAPRDGSPRPVTDETGLLEAIVLLGFQAGLSWSLVASRRAALRAALAGFDAGRLASFGPPSVDAALRHPGMIRNRRKIEAAVHNARVTLRVRDAGGLPEIVGSVVPVGSEVTVLPADGGRRSVESIELSRVLRGHGFRFVGPVSAHALLEWTGRVVAAGERS